MNELERRLESSAGRSRIPRRRASSSSSSAGPARRAVRRPLALALAVAVVALAGVLALSPGARSAFLELFHIRGATVELVETLPDVEAQRLDFGERVSRETAERRAGFELLDLGEEPDAIFIRPDGLASVVYGDRTNRGSCSPRPAARSTTASSRRSASAGHDRRARSGGRRARPLRRRPDHFVMFRDENGQISDERTYLAGTVLLWNRGDLLLRLEGDLTQAEALGLAESVG